MSWTSVFHSSLLAKWGSQIIISKCSDCKLSSSLCFQDEGSKCSFELSLVNIVFLLFYTILTIVFFIVVTNFRAFIIYTFLSTHFRISKIFFASIVAGIYCFPLGNFFQARYVVRAKEKFWVDWPTQMDERMENFIYPRWFYPKTLQGNLFS